MSGIPFTQMRDWLKGEPITITSGKGATLRDVHGKEYLDANSSIWDKPARPSASKDKWGHSTATEKRNRA